MKVEKLSASVFNKTILKNVSFELKRGELVALCGKNGAGKSTLLSAMAGVSEADLTLKGEISLEGKKLSDYKRKELAKKLAYMEQTEYSTWDFSVKDFVLQGRFAYSKNGFYSTQDYEVVKQAMTDVDILELAERTVHTLSGGEFQKVRIARSLAQQPEFMLLDEPSANLDFVYEPQLMKLLKKIAEEKKIGIVLSMHDVNMAKDYCSKMILLPPASAVIFGDVQEVLTLENLQTTFGVEFERTDGRPLFLPRGTK